MEQAPKLQLAKLKINKGKMQLETLGYSYQDGCIIYLSKRYVLFKNRQPVYRASSGGGGKREESKRNEKSSD